MNILDTLNNTNSIVLMRDKKSVVENNFADFNAAILMFYRAKQNFTCNITT